MGVIKGKWTMGKPYGTIIPRTNKTGKLLGYDIVCKNQFGTSKNLTYIDLKYCGNNPDNAYMEAKIFLSHYSNNSYHCVYNSIRYINDDTIEVLIPDTNDTNDVGDVFDGTTH